MFLLLILKDGFAPPEDGLVDTNGVDLIPNDEHGHAVTAGGDEDEY
jgi:hypothetical protein